jgi:signal transduction histidine kinase
VTALVGAEERARLDEERVEVVWQAAVERFGRAFALLDDKRRILRVNRTLARLLQHSPEDVVGKRCWEVMEICQCSPCPHELAFCEERRVVLEIVGKQSGKPLRIEINPAPPNDARIATIHVANDLTEERLLRSRLVTADRLASIGRLAAGVAHEVNNPAGFVTLGLQLAKDQIARGRVEEGLGVLDEALEAMLQINQIMRDLTGFTRERARSLTDLGGVASSAIRIASHEMQTRATVVRHLEEGVVAEVRGARIAQVVLNLLVNAAQAIPAGNVHDNRIEVCVRSDGDRVLIEVSDTGPGVPAEIGERIFEPFFTSREASGGSGLGLWLSRAIVEEEGGALRYCNRATTGACFTIDLPAPRAT